MVWPLTLRRPKVLDLFDHRSFESLVSDGLFLVSALWAFPSPFFLHPVGGGGSRSSAGPDQVTENALFTGLIIHCSRN